MHDTDSVHNQPPRTLETLSASMHQALDMLEEHAITPNRLTVETQRIPFGRFGDGSLSTILTLDEGYFSGKLSFSSGDKSHRPFFYVREIGDSTWWTSDRQKYATDEAVLRTLDANWPQHVIDNSPVRQAMDDENPTVHTVADLVRGHLEPHAKYHSTERIYAYSHMTVDDEGRCESSTLLLASEVDHDGFRTVTANITLPYTCNDVDTPLTCRVVIDELGDAQLTSFYEHPETKKPIDVPIHDITRLLEEFEIMIGQLIGEKLGR